MKNFRLIIFFPLLISKICTPQNNSFTKNYEMWNEYAMHNFQQTSDGGYIISTDAMYEMDTVASLGKGFLIKMDNAGATQWIKEFVKTGPYIKPRDGCSIFQCSDAGYIVSGSLYDSLGNPRIRLFRTDVSGNVLWSKIYPGLGLSAPFCVRQTSDGGYVVAGMTADPQNQTSYSYILKTNSSGIPQFGKVIMDPSGYTGMAFSVQEISNGEYIYCGAASNTPMIGKLSPSGTSIWNKRFSNSNYGGFYDLIQNASGSYTVTGTMGSLTANFMALINFGPAGNVNWEKYYTDWTGNIEGFSIKETTGGGMIVSNVAGYKDGMTLFNSSGDVIWNRVYTNSISWIPSTVEYTNDGGFAFTSAQYLNNYIVSVVKADAAGHATCHDTDVVFTSGQISYTMVSDQAFNDIMPYQIDNVVLINRVLNEGWCQDTIAEPTPVIPDPCESFFFVPNVFTPNGDDVNDVFRDSIVTCDPEYQMMIYDRWGALVFESKANADHWNGRTLSNEDASEGTYYYVLATKEKTHKGFLTLLR